MYLNCDRCDKRGTQFPYCVDGPSYCRCKPNVEGSICSQCRPGTFDLSANNPLGCTECYCSGVTDDCFKVIKLHDYLKSRILDSVANVNTIYMYVHNYSTCYLRGNK